MITKSGEMTATKNVFSTLLKDDATADFEIVTYTDTSFEHNIVSPTNSSMTKICIRYP